MACTEPLTVVVPTIGRLDLLRACLTSILACEPPPDEVVVVDQSGGPGVVGADRIARVPAVASSAFGWPRHRARDELRYPRATHQLVATTHDDCTVSGDWVSVARRLACAVPGGIVTGRVLAPAAAEYVPSTIADETPRDYTGSITSGVLFPANMVFSRDALSEFGGFDERAGLMLAAEDNDLCYRWLVDGRSLRYEPELVVWHHDWRSRQALIATHKTYARGQGAFYAKHLFARDWKVLSLLAWDLRSALRARRRLLFRPGDRWKEPYREMFGSLLLGIVMGLAESARLSMRAWRVDLGVVAEQPRQEPSRVVDFGHSGCVGRRRGDAFCLSRGLRPAEHRDGQPFRGSSHRSQRPWTAHMDSAEERHGRRRFVREDAFLRLRMQLDQPRRIRADVTIASNHLAARDDVGVPGNGVAVEENRDVGSEQPIAQFEVLEAVLDEAFVETSDRAEQRGRAARIGDREAIEPIDAAGGFQSRVVLVPPSHQLRRSTRVPPV